MPLSEETAMKWSQGLCASIFVEALYHRIPAARANPRMDRDFPASTANAFAADWRLAPEAISISLLELARPGGVKRRPPGVASGS
jgi:hypothetical protein